MFFLKRTEAKKKKNIFPCWGGLLFVTHYNYLSGARLLARPWVLGVQFMVAGLRDEGLNSKPYIISTGRGLRI